MIALHLANTISNLLYRDRLSRTIRRNIYRMVGLKIGDGTVIDFGGVFLGTGVEFGERCYVNSYCYFDLTGTISMGDDVFVGHGATFITALHSIGPATRRCGPAIGSDIVIGNGAWIGANATILPGVAIGSGAIVAAGAVVASSVAPNVIVAGVPARVIKRLGSDSEAPRSKEI